VAAAAPSASARHGGVHVTPLEYPTDCTSDSVTEDRVTALAGFGFT